MSDPLDAALLAAMRARHVAHVQARLVDARAEAAWRDNLLAGARAILAARVADLVDADKLAAALDALLAPEVVEAALRPAATAAWVMTEARLRSDPRAVGSYLAAPQKQALDSLVSQPGMLPERLWREAFANEAAEGVMRDVLYDALIEFNTKVNPFFADWGLPGLLRKLSPFGLGGMSKVLDSVRGEFDKRLEPEIRKFLKGFSRQALQRSLDFTIDNADTPEFVAIRKQLVAWVLAQRVGELCPPPGDVRATAAREVTLDIGAHLARDPALAAERRDTLEELCALHGRQTVAEAMESYGVDGQALLPVAAALAEATWPAMRVALCSEPLRAWVDEVVGGFYDQEIGRR
ncbi:MAG: hypothetical protein WKG00_30850 [Polyangiaceae bacterium]